MNQPIVFSYPAEVAGLPGFQIVDDETHEVVGVVLEDGVTPAPQPCGYVNA